MYYTNNVKLNTKKTQQLEVNSLPNSSVFYDIGVVDHIINFGRSTSREKEV